MTTFTLKKYEENKEQDQQTQQAALNADQQKEELTVSVVGSISEIVAKALHKALAHDVEIQEQPEGEAGNTKAISTEDINSAPLDTFNSINKDDAVFIHSENGFKTKEEEWFLTNIGNKTENVFYTLESFIQYIKRTLKVS